MEVICKWNSHGKPLHVWEEVHTRLGFTRAVDSHELQFGRAGSISELFSVRQMQTRSQIWMEVTWKPFHVCVEVHTIHTSSWFTWAPIWASWDLVFLVSLPCQRSDALRTKSSGTMPLSRRVHGLYRLRDVTATDCDVSSSQGFPKPRQPKPNKLSFRINPRPDNHQNQAKSLQAKIQNKMYSFRRTFLYYLITQIWQTNGWFLQWRKRENSEIFGTE